MSVPTATVEMIVDRLGVDFDLRVASGGRLHRPEEPAPTRHNVWVRERAGGPWRWQVNAEPVDATTWRYRRDERITRPRALAVVEIDGLPCTSPAVQLLWKAAEPRERDEADRAVVLPLLSGGEQRWLSDAIALAHPGSPWVG